ncbi:lytic transglycosylase domain-containing protein [Rhizobium ruizarguesonis]|jgi:type IV secretion system protein VirB1|uniref:lytic transglycosylase domain-containing protein n=1 Tax=Rhizobium ruizarguesonis TaxID=2081791 RepID=UPI00102FA8A1|nr:lytic transglycosylase domain-containing protein [Rhizobium ruizarguesonis]TAU03853.1 type IV secretion system protein VirB1 [Rhizobium ruizarguesonis]TAW14773.1 type IV secretion system protein VirB1 [Rhizobium ruizarguesonis]TAW96971.1 type IV secretion system protein VirB1 [Rhizobium ruizarguesonis]TAZ50099.1 type IV secretion system protein VirB1 [Rhizobium ruizarguesonis]WSH65855.1 lytic transglycosylase domain-containing protein [Rhizobium ruizarguesonis]
MAFVFMDLAQNCAPMVDVRTLAAVISLESGFKPFAIRINSGPPLERQPASRAEAIEITTSLVADRQDIQIGLGGIGEAELRRLKLSISDAFDPCLNLKATGTLLDGYYRLALGSGADARQAESVMLQSYYGRDDPSVGEMVKYDEQVRQERVHLPSDLTSLSVAEPHEEAPRADRPASRETSPRERFLSQSGEAASWDVFNARRSSQVLVFQNERSEQRK